MQHTHVQWEVAQSQGSMDHTQAVIIVDLWNLYILKPVRDPNFGWVGAHCKVASMSCWLSNKPKEV